MFIWRWQLYHLKFSILTVVHIFLHRALKDTVDQGCFFSSTGIPHSGTGKGALVAIKFCEFHSASEEEKNCWSKQIFNLTFNDCAKYLLIYVGLRIWFRLGYFGQRVDLSRFPSRSWSCICGRDNSSTRNLLYEQIQLQKNTITYTCIIQLPS